ncbi:MAG: radical SAM protein [Candidatus Omnitrophica bacterium]|nr:radical SAM protein [Candidatus Omnitrophota bacterium]
MTMAAPVYTKANSFADIRVRTTPEDMLKRIQQIPLRLEATAMSEAAKAVVRQACQELLEPAEAAGPALFRLHPYIVDEIGRLSDEELPRYVHYRYRYECYPQRKILDEFPPCLQVEPTSMCNYRCAFCYQTDAAFTQARAGHMGRMPLELFTQIVDQAVGCCEAVTLASRGEPSLCRELPAMLDYARGKFLALKLNTNASRLDERLCHAILSADVRVVVFSVDAASEPAYRQLRVGGTLAPVVANIRRFREIQQRHYPKARTISRISGVRVDAASSMSEMEAFWGGVVDQVAFVTYNPWENTYERPLNEVATPCSDLWRRMFVWWDGTVNPCDVDYRSTLAVGKVQEHRLSELWGGASYAALRTAHLQQARRGVAPCNRCTVV